MNFIKEKRDKRCLFVLDNLAKEERRRLLVICSTFLLSVVFILSYSDAIGQMSSVLEFFRLRHQDIGPNTRFGSSNWHNLLVEEPNTYMKTLQQMLFLNLTGTPECSGARTTKIKLEGLPTSEHGTAFFLPDKIHELTIIIAYGADGTRRCGGGDYFEVDFHDASNVAYRSRLPTVDYGNGSYGLQLIVPSRFAGSFILDIYLLFGNWHGLDVDRNVFKQEITESIPLLTEKVQVALGRKGRTFPDPAGLNQCNQSDFDQTTWQGRWTRTLFNDSCEPDDEKRYRCLPDDHYSCEEPWCFGPLGRLESNGWSYSAHCSFKIFEPEEAWRCLNGKWILAWGDSNFQDTMRNLVLFILDWKLPSWINISDWQLERSFEFTFVNPANSSESLRVSEIFNGANIVQSNFEGLYTLTYEEHQQKLLEHFNEEQKPDVVFMTSGLHDPWKFDMIEQYAAAVDFTINWWSDLYNKLPPQQKPTMIWKTTVAPAGKSKRMNSNANKMEMYNLLTVEKFQQARFYFPVKIFDAFDLTFPFHYSNEYSDGGHYGRAPGYKGLPWGGQPHWYFVDIMLANILLNVICPKPP